MRGSNMSKITYIDMLAASFIAAVCIWGMISASIVQWWQTL